MPPKAEVVKTNKEDREKALVAAFENFDLTITSDGYCEVIESKEMPKEVCLMDPMTFVEKYRTNNNVEGLLDMVKHLSAIKDRCEELIGDILGIN